MTDITALAQRMKPGLYAILFRNNWDGEGDTYEALATLDSNHIWHDYETGKELPEYEGDAILKAWPLDDGSNVLALVEALEKAQRHEQEWKSLCEAAAVDLDDWLNIDDKSRELICKFADAVIARNERIAELENDLAAEEERRSNWFRMAEELGGKLDAAEERIRELESRTVTLEPFRSFVTNDDIAALHRFAECCDDPESGGHDLEREQVRRLEAIGALQRSGRVSYITGFGDVLISITAGIQVIEGEGQ